MLSISKRGVVKFAARCITISATIQAATSTIDYVVDPQTETANDRVQAGGFIAGTLVGYYAADRVDDVIDRVADWRIARKNEKEDVTE